MKKQQFTLILFFTASIIVAQPQFGSNNCFQLNDSSKLGFAITTQTYTDYISTTGNNYTWDFTSTGTPGPWTTWTNPTTNYAFQPASQSIHYVAFNTSQINEYCPLSFSRDLFYTYSTNNDTLYFDGLYTSNNYRYSPSVPYLSFPLNYNDSVYTYTKQYPLQNMPDSATGSVSRYWIYDGFGTVKLPYGTVANVYRIRTKQIDSIYIINTANTYEEMIWFRQSDGIPLLRFAKNGSFFNVYYASADGASSIADIKPNNKETIIYPNPFNSSIDFALPNNEEAKRIRVYNCEGQNVIDIPAPQNNKINTELLAQGIYIIEIESNNSVIRKRLIK